MNLRNDLRPLLDSVTTKLREHAKEKILFSDCPLTYLSFVKEFYSKYGNDSFLEKYLIQYTNIGIALGPQELDNLEQDIWNELGPIPGQTEDFKAYSMMFQILGQMSHYNER